MNSLYRVTGIVLVLCLALLLSGPGSSLVLMTVANTGSCVSQGTTASFGIQTWASDCTVISTQQWGNGTLTIAGNLIVNIGTRLTLWNMVVQMNPSSDQQYRIYLAGGQLVVRGGTLTSANTNFGWRLETTSSSGILVDIDRTNVSYAGSGSNSGFLLLGGNGHRLRHLDVTNSALSPSAAVIDVNGGSIADVRVENSTFSNTGTAFNVR